LSLFQKFSCVWSVRPNCWMLVKNCRNQIKWTHPNRSVQSARFCSRSPSTRQPTR